MGFARHFSSIEVSRAAPDSKHHSLRDVLAAIDSWDNSLCPQSTAIYASAIRLCANSRSLPVARRIRDHLAARGCDRATFLGNLLVELFGKCGSVRDSRQAFDKILQPNTYSWNIIMAAYTGNGNLREARSIFAQMPDKDAVSWNALMAAYSQYRQPALACDVFERMPQWDVWSWNVLIRVYSQAGLVDKAKEFFDSMPQRTIVSWNVVLSGYAQNRYLDESERMFAKIPMRDVVVWNEVIVAFIDTGSAYRAIEMLEKMPEFDTISWNTQTRAFASVGNLEKAKWSFDSTPRKDFASFTTMLVAYAQYGDLAYARSMFDRLPCRDTVAWTAMVSAYAQNGHVDSARKLFEEMPEKNFVAWNAMVAAYGQNSDGKTAVFLFKTMDLEGFPADSVSFVSALDGCALETALAEGKIVHGAAVESGFDRDISVANSLVNMYARCGCLVDARALFDRMASKSVVSWTTMVAAYAKNSDTLEAFRVFRVMSLEGTPPNEVTFTIILSLCSQAGKLHDARKNFLDMKQDFGLEPRVDHYMCMVDLIARSGRLEVAEELISTMPYKPDPLAWRTLLSACRNQENSSFGAQVAEQALDPEMKNAASYVLLSNTFT